MGFRFEIKLLLQRIAEVLHFGKVAAFVVFEHTFEYVDVEKCAEFQCLFGLLIRRIHEVTSQVSKRYLRCGILKIEPPGITWLKVSTDKHKWV